MILEILTHTPIWVFVLFAIIVSMGAKRLSDGERDVRRVCLVPILFILFGLLRLSNQEDSGSISAWLVAACAGLVIGSLARPVMRNLAGNFRVLLAGSAWPLVRIVVIFVAHYSQTVAAVLSFDHRVAFMRLDAAVSGMAARYFAGLLWRFVQAFRVAKATPAAATGMTAVAR